MYNTLFDVAFSVDHNYEDPNDIPVEILLEALEKRLMYLKANSTEAKESFGFSDTYEADQ